MEFRRDLLYSDRIYNQKRGLLTLGEFKNIQLENGQNIELQPYLIETHIAKGGTREKDPRIRMNNDVAIPKLAQAYANYFNEVLGEHWTVEKVEAMLHWQLEQSLGRYFLVKWAKDIEKDIVFPIGFFCAYIKPFQMGNMLWDGEAFVLPEYRQFGIGTELTEALFTIAKLAGVDFFEALTFEDANGYPLKFWQKLGVNSDDLIHIYGETEKILVNIEEEKKNRTL